MPQGRAWLAYLGIAVAILSLLAAVATYDRAGARVTVWYLQELVSKDFWATLLAGGDDFGDIYVDIRVRNSGQAPAEIENFVLTRATLLRGAGRLDVSNNGAVVLVEGPELPAQLAGGHARWYRYQVKGLLLFERGRNPHFTQDFWDLAHFTRRGSLTVTLGSGSEVTWKRSWATEFFGPSRERLALHSRRKGKSREGE